MVSKASTKSQNIEKKGFHAVDCAWEGWVQEVFKNGAWNFWWMLAFEQNDIAKENTAMRE